MPFREISVRGRACPVFVPPGRAPRPCVLFLHGIGQNGDDGRHLEVGLPPYVRDHAATFPAVALFPQCRGPWKYVGEEERFVLDALAEAERTFGIDPARIYLTGLSQGGCSAFDLGAKYPGKWAAIVVVCGAGRPEDATRLAKIPLWIFHGELDEAVPPSGGHVYDRESVGGRDMARLIPGARYTEYPGADHFIWDRVYADPAMWSWLFAQGRPDPRFL
jgi:predicted peptidase